REILELLEDSINASLLGQDMFLLHSKFYLYTDRKGTMPHQSRLSLQQIETITENHNWTQYRNNRSQGTQPTDTVHYNSCTYGRGNISGEKKERL
ncbi:hypothetical protein ACQP3D_26985, partial [Escherichia coli]